MVTSTRTRRRAPAQYVAIVCPCAAAAAARLCMAIEVPPAGLAANAWHRPEAATPVAFGPCAPAVRLQRRIMLSQRAMSKLKI